MDQRVPDAIDILQIMTRLPHRYPMLLIDRILALEPGERIVGLKNVSMEESFFVGHFPGHPIMPAVLVVEAMAQIGAVLVSFRPDAAGYITHLLSVERVRFSRLVRPGDQLIIQVVALRGKGRFGKAQATAEVDGVVAAEGVLTYGMMKGSLEAWVGQNESSTGQPPDGG
jgi:3-hydroxyacyl-[acyl-carrier-protein] dehydratase